MIIRYDPVPGKRPEAKIEYMGWFTLAGKHYVSIGATLAAIMGRQMKRYHI